jgi:hypothetical protein
VQVALNIAPNDHRPGGGHIDGHRRGQLAHNTSSILTATTRRMLYFRLGAVGHRDRWASTFTDAFTEYPLVRAAIGS